MTFEEVLDDDRKHNIVVIGPSGSGKTHLSNYIAGEHKRGVVSLADLLEWHKAQGNEIATTIEEWFVTKEQELEETLAEREKMKKKLKKKYDEWEQENPLLEDDYKFLPHELLDQLLKERLAHPDCNAGVVFDNIESRLYNTTRDGVEWIMRATPTQKLQVVALVDHMDEDGLPQSMII